MLSNIYFPAKAGNKSQEWSSFFNKESIKEDEEEENFGDNEELEDEIDQSVEYQEY